MNRTDASVDVLVIGAGGCGLAAAIAAHDLDANVALIEKRQRPGGNTSLSTGSIPGAGTRFQRAAGIEDSPEQMLADLIALSGPHDVPELVELLVDRSALLVEWLADTAGVQLDVISDYKHVAHSVPRLHAPPSRKGTDLTHDLLRAVEQRGIPLALASPAVELCIDGAGAVVGAVVRDSRGETSRIGAAKVILAVNGFGNDHELLAEYCGEIADAAYVGARGSEGEAIRWGRSLRARLGNMASYQGYATILRPHGELLSWTTIEKGGFLVNSAAERFGNEAIGYSGFAAPVLRQDEPVHAIFDQRMRDVAAREPWFKEILDYGAARRAESIEDLAAATGLEAGRLRQTIEAYNRAAAGADVDPNGRKAFGLAPLEPPYWFARVTAALLSTQGGLVVDHKARVLDDSGQPICNLFAGGGAVAGISGRAGGIGYASGSGLLHALGLGWIAGEAAATELGWSA